MSFQSILYSNGRPALKREAPACFHDLRIDAILHKLLEGLEEYELSAVFYTSLNNTADIIYRQDILNDIETTALLTSLKLFTETMKAIRVLLAEGEKFTYVWQQRAIFLEQMNRYCTAVKALAADLFRYDINATGLIALREYLMAYIGSSAFTAFARETDQLTNDLAAVRYSVIIDGLRVQVREYRDEPDFSSDIAQTFERFQHEPVKDYHAKVDDYIQMNHVEAAVLDGVVTLYPELFRQLENYCNKYVHYLDPTIGAFDREVHFYLGWIKYTEKAKDAGLHFCFPAILTETKTISARNSFDVALATALVSKGQPVITNDFYLGDNECIIIVSGPNQGGKTTFARTFGQLHYLASIGLSVPGTEAELFLYDNLFTHFEREEDISTHRSKFEDDLFRIHEILKVATSNSIIIFNEILSSTTLQDALTLSKKVMEAIDQLDCLCVWITFMDELVGYSTKTVSMVSTIVPEDPTVRTFKVIRKPADGLAYALSIAEKYGITYSRLKERLGR